MGDTRSLFSAYRKMKKVLKQIDEHDSTPLDLATATTLQERTENFMKICESAHENLLNLCTTDDAQQTHEDNFEPIETCYVDIKSKLRALIPTLTPAPTAGPTGAGGPTTGTLNVRLPAIELPTFDGNYADWPSFLDLFTATVDSNSHLAPAQKLQYLKAALQKEPKNLIKSLTITDLHYSEALKILKERYDNKRDITTSLITKLLNQKALTNENATELQKLVDTTTEILRSLRVLGSPVEEWDHLLVVLLVNKLDSSTKREWAIRQTGSSMSTVDELKKFILNHIRGLQASGTTPSTIPPRRAHPPPPGFKTHHSGTTQNCVLCDKNQNHLHYLCPDFRSKTPSERSNLAKKHNLCFNCLNRDHRINNCKSTSTCKFCKRRHHSLLHEEVRPQQPPRQDGPPPPPTTYSSTPPNGMSSCHIRIEVKTLLQTALVHVEDSWGRLQLVRVFLDGGSEGTLITEDCVRRLGLKRSKSKVIVSGVGEANAGTSKGFVHLMLQSRHDNSGVTIGAHVLKTITGMLPRITMTYQEWPHLQGLQLADPEWYTPSQIDILLGMDYLNNCLSQGLRVGPPLTPTAQNTLFGWILSGQLEVRDSKLSSHHVITGTTICNMINVEDIVKKFWEVEEPPKARILTKEEKSVEAHFLKNYSRDNHGRFIVGVPFNNKKYMLGASRGLAVGRFLSVEKRLQRSPSQKQQYIDFMREYLALGHMEKIPVGEPKEIIGSTYHLPHHHVINEGSSTTKLRVVFDGSAKTSTGISLNDAQQVGATLQDDLYDIILRFRLHQFVLKADITKMFRQFQLKREDADFHRIVWRENSDMPLEDYRLLTITYGTACAPNLSTRCLQQVAVDCKETYPQASHVLHKDAYVDDLMTSVTSIREGINLYNQLTKAVSTAGLQLRKWATNSPEILAAIPQDHRETSAHSLDSDETLKALGVQWCPSADTFTFKAIQTGGLKLTKRVLLSELSKVFDPIGLLSCVTVRAKLQMQELWRQQIGWDEEVPVDVQQQWEAYQQDLTQIPLLSVPRRLTIDDAVKYQIHGFSDSSTIAYGCVLYLRAEAVDGTITTSFITSKTRVAPLRQITLPRLELMSACELSELVAHVKDTLQLDCEIWCWSDSTITLRWIAGSPRRWQTFVANRVAKIQEHTEVEWWRHVPGTENPADLASRGVPVSTILNDSFWFKGPRWLSEKEFPQFKMNQVPVEYDMEEKKVHVTIHHTTMDSLLTKYSSLKRLRRVTAYLFRYKHNLLRKNQRLSGSLTLPELETATRHWIKIVQKQEYQNDITHLQQNKRLPENSKLHSFFPFLDSDGLLRVGGRLEHAQLTDQRKHQILLPKSSYFTELVIDHYHNVTYHGGFTLTFTSIQRKYWIVNGRDKVRHFVRKCLECRLQRGKCAEQLMGSLPTPRVTPSRPFVKSGVDYAGPFTLKNPIGRAPKTYKAYLCLFVCMATKAIHLEAVTSLTTSSFIESMRRFTSRRGLPKHLYSDNGTNFIGAEKELQRFLRDAQNQQQIVAELAEMEIEFHFNPPSSPHQGGLWEAGVKSTKHHLKRVVGSKVLTYEAFSTFLCQVEAILNSRPIHPMSSEPGDFEALTPGHFLIGAPLLAIPEGDYTGVKSNRLNQFQQLQQLLQQFWKRWSYEYLNTLQMRKKWNHQRDNLEVGELVLIKDDNVVQQWRKGRIIEVHPGSDNKVRVVTLKTATGLIQRPIVKLVPLLKQD